MPIPSSPVAAADPRPRWNPLMFFGVGALFVAVGASGILVADHLGLVNPPGCSVKSPCRAAVNSIWGKVPGVNWPVSFLGFSYFVAMLTAWIAAGGRPSTLMKWFARLGAAASTFYVGVMLVDKLLCPYCLTSHIANLAFFGICEFSRPAEPRRSPLKGLAALAGIFAIASVALGFADSQAKQKVEDELDASIQAMVNASKRTEPTPAPSNTPPSNAATGAVSTPPGSNQTTQPAATPTSPPIVLPTVFTGRFRWGPEIAPIRIVMFTGYQCPDCKKIDPQIRDIIDTRKDVSVSIKHFPFCSECNPHVPNMMHPNACWAARAAEAAGILHGTAGFRKMHDWLFSRGGSFTAADLSAVLLQWGWDGQSFVQTMQSPTTLRNVQTDIEEAISYGLRFTPMIFINGEELKGWQAADAVTRAVNAIAAINPEPRGPEADRPPKAGDKYVADWREQPAMAWPSRANLPALGNASGIVKITVFGDLLEPNTAEADRTIRNAMAGRTDMWYEFRYFPVDKSCNPTLPQTLFPQGCRAARAAEAANALGGPLAYWKMHEWIMANAKTFNDATLRAAAPSLGLNADDLFKKMDDPELVKMVELDANIGSRLHITEIPRISVNGKHVPRWNLKDQFVLERIIEEAAVEQPPK